MPQLALPSPQAVFTQHYLPGITRYCQWRLRGHRDRESIMQDVIGDAWCYWLRHPGTITARRLASRCLHDAWRLSTSVTRAGHARLRIRYRPSVLAATARSVATANVDVQDTLASLPPLWQTICRRLLAGERHAAIYTELDMPRSSYFAQLRLIRRILT